MLRDPPWVSFVGILGEKGPLSRNTMISMPDRHLASSASSFSGAGAPKVGHKVSHETLDGQACDFPLFFPLEINSGRQIRMKHNNTSPKEFNRPGTFLQRHFMSQAICGFSFLEICFQKCHRACFVKNDYGRHLYNILPNILRLSLSLSLSSLSPYIYICVCRMLSGSVEETC